MDDNDWIGVLCYICGTSWNSFSYESFKTKGRYPFIVDMAVDFYGDLELVSDESEHMWLFFLSQRLFIEEYHLQGTSNLGSMKQEFKIISY